MKTPLTKRLGLMHPVIQAPLAGGGDTAELVAAVCNAGGLGFIGAAYLTPDQIIARAHAVRALTSRPFGINLFAPQPAAELPANAGQAVSRISAYHAELGIEPPEFPDVQPDPFSVQFEAVLETDAAVFSFTLGLIPPASVRAVKQRMYVIGTATTVEEAVALENSGVDAIVAQGSEAGGHRGSFLHSPGGGLIGTMVLVPQVVDAVSVPVIASGGVMDGRGLAASMLLGAAAVQMGTAFLTCDEAGASPAYRARILEAKESETRITTAFSGREARGIVNRAMDELDQNGAILPFPLQNQLTRRMRTEAARRDRHDYLSLWAGQGLRLARRQSAAALVERVAAEAEALLSSS